MVMEDMSHVLLIETDEKHSPLGADADTAELNSLKTNQIHLPLSMSTWNRKQVCCSLLLKNAMDE